MEIDNNKDSIVQDEVKSEDYISLITKEARQLSLDKIGEIIGTPNLKDLVEKANNLYDGKQDEFVTEFAPDELASLWVVCTFPFGQSFDDEVYEAIQDCPKIYNVSSKEIFDLSDSLWYWIWSPEAMKALHSAKFAADDSVFKQVMKDRKIEVESMDEALTEATNNKGRFHLEVWVPGSGGEDDRERDLIASDNMADIINTAYNTKLDSDEAFYLSDWKGIYDKDLDQVYSAEDLEDQIENVWGYSGIGDLSKTLGKALLPQNESVEESTTNEVLDESIDNIPDVTGVIPGAMRQAKDTAEEVDDMISDAFKEKEKEAKEFAKQNAKKETKKVTSPELKKMHLSESLFESTKDIANNKEFMLFSQKIDDMRWLLDIVDQASDKDTVNVEAMNQWFDRMSDALSDAQEHYNKFIDKE